MINRDKEHLKKLGPFNPQNSLIYKKKPEYRQNLNVETNNPQKYFSNMFSSDMSGQPKEHSPLRLARLNEELTGLKEYLVSDKSSVCAQEITF